MNLINFIIYVNLKNFEKIMGYITVACGLKMLYQKIMAGKKIDGYQRIL